MFSPAANNSRSTGRRLLSPMSDHRDRLVTGSTVWMTSRVVMNPLELTKHKLPGSVATERPNHGQSVATTGTN
ncbi:MAG: hypothetical protein MHM6MM_000395 [Cercozoa sp. M6MM]